ncbi:hypothetical protein BC831DRAFT_465310 [Entophlyctis helioformis]|nr:hypothetical protein BC831DRAFT_465310 [Entophlyctis helioformis]
MQASSATPDAESSPSVTMKSSKIAAAKEMLAQFSEAERRQFFMNGLAELEAQESATTHANVPVESSSNADTGDASLPKLVVSQSVVDGFVAPFMDPHSVVEDLVKYIDWVTSEWSKSYDLIAPIGSVIQASGMGKTRLLIEAGKHRFVMFICLRGPSENGYPLQSDIVKKIPTDSLLITKWLLRLIIACMRHLVKTLEKQPLLTPAEWISMQLDRKLQSSFWSEIVNTMESGSMRTFVSKFPSDSPRVSTDDISDEARPNRRETACELFKVEMEKLKSALAGKQPECPTGLVFAMDEASRLSDYPDDKSIDGHTHFDRFRELFGCIARCESNGIMGLLLDTNGSIDKFAPAATPTKANSLRAIDAKQLLLPFWNLRSFDICTAKDSFELVSCIITTALKEKTYNSLEQLFDNQALETSLWQALRHIGRPLWLSITNAGEVHSMVRIAMSKLCADTDVFSVFQMQSNASNNQNTEPAYRAAFSTLVCPHIKARNVKDTAIMTEQFMALCTSISNDREAMTIMYPSDAVLAEAAHCTLKFASSNTVSFKKDRLDTTRWYFMLLQLSVDISNGFMGAGDRGELVARIVLLAAASQATWHASPHCSLTMPLTVSRFLSSIFSGSALNTATDQSGSENAWRDAFPTDLLNGVIFFNHFAFTEEHSSVDLLHWAFNRCAAIRCRDGQIATDLVIPVLLGQTYTVLMIQVKNQAQKLSDRDIDKITLRHAGFTLQTDKDNNPPPHLVIAMSLCERKDRLVVQVPKDSSNRYVIVAGGFREVYSGIEPIAGSLSLFNSMFGREQFGQSVDLTRFLTTMTPFESAKHYQEESKGN